MNNYYVIEIQTNADGTSGIIPFGFEDKSDAQAKFGTLYAAAAKSSVLIHTIMFVDKLGVDVVRPAHFTHPAEEPTPEE